MSTLARAGATIALLLLPAAAQARGPRMAILAVGPEDRLTGALQYALEQQIPEGVEVALTSSAGVARVLGQTVPPPPPVDDALRKRWLRSLDAAAQAYYEDRLGDAQVELSNTARLQTGVLPPADDVVRLELLRAAIAMARGDTEGAATHAAAALVLRPELSVSANEFPPSLVSAVDEARALLQWTTIEIRGTPPGAEVLVDDHPPGAELRVPMGRHTLSVRAPGFRPLRFEVQVSEGAVLHAPAPIALGAPLGERLQQMLWQRKRGLTREDSAALRNAARQLRVDRILVTGMLPGSQTAALLWSAGRAPKRVVLDGASSAQQREIAAWVTRRLNAEQIPTGRAGAWSITGDAGVALDYASRRVDGDGGGHMDSGWFGAGALLEGKGTRTPLVVQGRLLVLNHDFAPSNYNLPSGERVDLGGGTFLQVRVGGGLERTFREVHYAPVLHIVGMAWFEMLSAEDLRDSAGPLGLLPSHRSFGIDAEAGGGGDIAGLHLSVDFISTLFGLRSEDPKGTTGSSPGIRPTFGIRLGASLARSGPWDIGVFYEFQRRDIGFTGSASARTAPAISDARVRESRHGLIFHVRRAF